jgi:flagellar hook-length control protein FliK
MSDFSTLPLPEAGAHATSLPAHSPISTGQPLRESNAGLVEVDELIAVSFDELLLKDLLLEPQVESPAPQAPQTGLTESVDADVSEMAQQFLASLMHNEVMHSEAIDLMAPASANVEIEMSPEMRAAPVALSASLNVKTAREEAVPSGELQPVPVKAEHKPVTLPDADTREPLAARKSAVPLELESLRPVVLKALNGSNTALVTGETPAAKINAPLVVPKGGEMLGAQLQQALGERLSLQVNNHIQHATIRLDPPEMGRLEIAIQVEAGKIQVQITAGQSDVYRALQQVSNELRQALTEQHYVEADVQIFSQQPGQQPPHQGKPHPFVTGKEFILANEQPDDTYGTRKRDDNTILMTV